MLFISGILPKCRDWHASFNTVISPDPLTNMIPSVPITFYFLFWLRNSLAAFGLGVILGFFAIYFFDLIFKMIGEVDSLTIPFVGTLLLTILLAQIFIFKHFYGRARGNFEYAYKERLISKEGNTVVLKEIGKRRFVELFWEELSDFSDTREDIYRELLVKLDASRNNAQKFPIYMKMSKSAVRHFNFDEGIKWLKMALALRPNDLVANFRLAIALEKAGDGAWAITLYETVLDNCGIESFELKDFIEEQIARVKKNGPAERPPMVGLRYFQF